MNANLQNLSQDCQYFHQFYYPLQFFNYLLLRLKQGFHDLVHIENLQFNYFIYSN